MSTASRYLLPRPVAKGRGAATRRNAGRTIVAIGHTLALAGFIALIVHIVIVLLVPRFAPVDAWAKLSAITRPWAFNTVAVPAGAPDRKPAALAGLDPRFGTVACRFDLRDGPASIVAEGEVPFWSLAVFDRRGQNIYSLNDRTAIEDRLDLVVMNATQRARLRENPIEGIDRSVLVRATIDEGFVLVRALAPDETWVPAVQGFLGSATCERLVLPASD